MTACGIDCAIDQNSCEVRLASDAAPDSSQQQTMENMGRINSLFDQPMLRDDVLAHAAKYLDTLGLLKPIRDFMSCSDLHLPGPRTVGFDDTGTAGAGATRASRGKEKR